MENVLIKRNMLNWRLKEIQLFLEKKYFKKDKAYTFRLIWNGVIPYRYLSHTAWEYPHLFLFFFFVLLFKFLNLATPAATIWENSGCHDTLFDNRNNCLTFKNTVKRWFWLGKENPGIIQEDFKQKSLPKWIPELITSWCIGLRQVTMFSEN